MIRLTRLSHAPIVVNADLIQMIESTPDTVLTLTNGQKVMVLEAAGEVVNRVIGYRRAVLQPPVQQPRLPAAAGEAHGEE
jgi:flagellar protein FlbD